MSGATSTVSLFDLLAELQRRGIRLSLAGDALEVPAPNDALTPELRARLSSHKADLLALLRRQHANAAPSTPFADAAADGEDALPPILAGFVSAVPAGAEDELPTPGSRFADRLGDLSADERRATLLALVSSSAAEFLELPREAVVPEVALTNLGFNSLMALELRDRLQAALGLRLSVADLWKDLRPVAIAEQLLAAWLLARVTLLAP